MIATGSEAQSGVRERKRIATRNAIQRAVLTLALDRGYDGVTVEEISHAAGVSPRTFFNYFPTKEAAVIGDLPELPDAESVDRFVAAGPGESMLDGIRDLLLTTVDQEPNPDGADLEGLRRTLLREYPYLFTLRMASMKQLEFDLVSVVERRLRREDPLLADDPERLHSRARLVTFVAFAAIRHAWSCWAETGGHGALADRLIDSFAELRELVRNEGV
ncbi:TetR/AcrR family transcriptional regulator [Humibacter sp.]|uniref:TetR/AcrR family transcriptional regulator n=1 Tax=Humibacter sp. TaxID=1940291 RepID=UPI002CCC8F70|nr:TetR family transcriptional regulator [Humibacter sp.]HVX09448.1 TetR family transcriptional regulator [Humibacter sp.]